MTNSIDELDIFFPRPGQSITRKMGVVVGGSLSKGLDIKLESNTHVEDVAVGRYVVIEGEQNRFFGMITDVLLDNINPMIQSIPPDVSDPFLQEIYQGFIVFGKMHVSPMLIIDRLAEKPLPVKTVPIHFSNVRLATEEDVNLVFGPEDETHFYVGEPLDMENVPINLDLQRITERSVGVFGKSGTGKSFLTRILLSGMIHKDVAVCLIFDMHNDYGWEIQTERGHRVKGLKQLFSSKVSIFTLDEASSLRRDVRPDHIVTMSWKDITPEDMEIRQCQDNLRFHQSQ